MEEYYKRNDNIIMYLHAYRVSTYMYIWGNYFTFIYYYMYIIKKVTSH